MSEPQRPTVPADNRSHRKHQAILAVQEVTFCLTITCAFGYSSLGYIYRNRAFERAGNDSTYYFLRSAFRINDLLHIKSLSSVDPDSAARQFQFRWNQVGYDLLAIISVISVAALLLLLLRLASDSISYRKSLSRAAGLTAILAAPLCYLYFFQFFDAWRFEPLLFPAFTYLQNSASIVAIVEIFCVIIVLVLFRKHRMPLPLLIIFVIAHCLFWILAPWPAVSLFLWSMYAPYLFVAILTSSGIVWLLSAFDSRTSQPEMSVKTRAGKWTIGVAAAAALALCLLWFPPLSHSLSHPQNMDSLRIEFSRGPYVYTLTILGDGHVVLVAHQHDRHLPDRGPQEKIITREQMLQILESLDRANFLALEDRAFNWCFDTSTVGVSVSLDGKTKRVVSDIGCTDRKNGVQSKFVHAASEIDRIVGTDDLLACQYRPCRK